MSDISNQSFQMLGIRYKPDNTKWEIDLLQRFQCDQDSFETLAVDLSQTKPSFGISRKTKLELLFMRNPPLRLTPG